MKLRLVAPRARALLFFLPALALFCTAAQAQKPYEILPDKSVARNWSEALIQALRRDTGRVAYNARVVYQFSVAVYDAWAAYDDSARPFLLGQTVNGFHCPFNEAAIQRGSKEAQRTAISYAAYTFLLHRFAQSPGGLISYGIFDDLMEHYGHDINHFSMDYESDRSAASFGNYIGDCVIRFGLGDGSSELDGHLTHHYAPVNPPLDPLDPASIDALVDPDRWQAIKLAAFTTKTGNVLSATPDFETPEWGFTVPFAMSPTNKVVYQRDGAEYWVYYDGGKPALISQTDPDAQPEEFIWGHSLVAVWSGQLDPTKGRGAELIDISPASIGNNPPYPQTLSGLRDFYFFLGGGDRSPGHAVNPATGQPYTPQYVPLGDYARVLASWWADGPFTAETPAGSMMLLLNEEISDAPGFEKRIGGRGPIVDDLEWDVKAYFALAGAVHDAAVATWSMKGWYDSSRPITAIRYMGTVGQSSDPNDPHCPYHPQGIKYVSDPSDPAGDGSGRVIDCVRPGDPLADGGANVGKIKLWAWRGPQAVANPQTDTAGVGWILAENWWPLQRADFVTPPFAGYVSGHATLTRAGAQVLTLLTGSPYFPSGLYEYPVKSNEFLEYERGPTVDMTLQFATYFDLADSAGLSRLWAGVHPPVDDVPGRRTGAMIGDAAYAKAQSYFSGKAQPRKAGGGSAGWLEALFLGLLTLALVAMRKRRGAAAGAASSGA